jgi:hypothetical protein
MLSQLYSLRLLLLLLLLLQLLLLLLLLLAGMSKLPPFVGGVWRGVKADLRAQYPKGRKFFWCGFSSCTTTDNSVLEADMSFGKDSGRTLFHTEKCPRAADIRSFPAFAQGAEVLLLAGTRLLEVVNVI